MKKRIYILFYAFIIQSSFALEIERKIYTPNDNTYEFPPIKSRISFNITFNLSKITEHRRRIFNAYNPSRWGNYTDRNTKRNRKTKNSHATKIGGYKPKSKFNGFGKRKGSSKKIKRKNNCSYGNHNTCYKNKCFCTRNQPGVLRPVYGSR